LSECKYVDGQPFYDQNWSEYDLTFIDFTVQYTQLMMGFFIKKGIFSSFPYNLPPYHLIPTLGMKVKTLRDEINRRGLDTSDFDAQLPEDILNTLDSYTVENLSNEQQHVRALFDSFMNMSRYGLKMREHTFPKFENIHLAQNLISICSLSEGYIVTSLSYLLRKNKSLIISKRYSYNINANIDDTVFKLTSKSFVVNLDNIEKHLSLSFNISNKRKSLLKELFLIRNLYVHNNGLVNNHFLKATLNHRKLKNGEKVNLDEQEIEALLDNLTDVLHLFYKATSIKCLNKKKEQLIAAPQKLEVI
jgi:hypothetical protein